MKISYTHPDTGNRTSITLSNQMIRLWGTVNQLDTDSDDFMVESIGEIKGFILESHTAYSLNQSNFPTLVSYIENRIIIEADELLKRFQKS